MKDIGKRTFQVNFQQSIREMYHGYEPVAISSIDELPGTDVGLRIIFASNVPEFSHFQVALDSEPFEDSRDGVAVVRFADSRSEERAVAVKAVMTDGSESQTYTLSFGFSPKTPEGVAITRDNNRVRMHTTPTLYPAPAAMDDWKYPIPTDEEIAFADNRWGDDIATIEGDYERARFLGSRIIADLIPCYGTPTDRMSGKPPFEQYELMLSGEEKGFCTNFGAIFECACKCFGILARRLAMCDAVTASHRLFTQNTSNHCTTEVFDRGRNQWMMMDMTHYILGTFLGDEGPLTVAEFHMFLNQPHRRERLFADVYDTEQERECRVPFAELPKKMVNYSYEGWGTEIGYRRI